MGRVVGFREEIGKHRRLDNKISHCTIVNTFKSLFGSYAPLSETFESFKCIVDEHPVFVNHLAVLWYWSWCWKKWGKTPKIRTIFNTINIFKPIGALIRSTQKLVDKRKRKNQKCVVPSWTHHSVSFKYVS